ncbi:trypsin-like serine protease [Marinicella sediminis]|uniref:Trypsin-like serine protease n=1 Tax=Marinicella sediminis TaxID=1792834 RepID=A0ABV7JF73_9GAMM|nr:trypsin-like serine protease [Marinicella sediminis]
MLKIFILCLSTLQIFINGDDFSTGQPLFEEVVKLKNLELLDRVIDGEPFLAVNSELMVSVPPWMVSIVNERGAVLCSGGLLNSQWMVTAEHCLLNNQYLVRYKHTVKPILDGLTVVSWKPDSKHTHPLRECTFGNEYDLKLVQVATVESDGYLQFQSNMTESLDDGHTLLTAAYPKNIPRKMTLEKIDEPSQELRTSCGYQNFQAADLYFSTKDGVICKTDSGGVVVNGENKLTALISQACDVNASPDGEDVELCEQFSNITRTQPFTAELIEQIQEIIGFYENGAATESGAFCKEVFSG